ncbi:hypothetical protein [Mycolicibacterium sp.]|uniref:hypothetical protein n=1 Tax=Mycolicibacterium sp. TaxID=2320850 RepID=UPI001A2A3A90|nr:hypothetical protein [Mycolicibacterium sp.]MBJ7340335.1 hypothetical protein [Mycolicibacterium sp.]
MRALLTVAGPMVAWVGGGTPPPQDETRSRTLLLGTAHVTVNDAAIQTSGTFTIAVAC